jgi:hypothetical protein
MHKTDASEKRKALKAGALELERYARVAEILPNVGLKACELESQAKELKAEAEALEGAARLEDLTL